MKTRKNDSLVEFELQNAEMENITGGNLGYSGGGIVQGCYCSGDRGNHDTQTIYYYTGCESLDGDVHGYGDC